MAVSDSSDKAQFIGIDVSGAHFDVAWHRGGCATHTNRPEAIAAFVQQLGGRPIARIVLEPTGGYEKPLVAALRAAGQPIEIVHTSRFAAFRTLLGCKAKSDRSDARLLAAYAAAPDEVRGRRADHVDIAPDAAREELAMLAARRDQLKQMIHAESCRLAVGRSDLIRDQIKAHLDALRTDARDVLAAMLRLVRRNARLAHAKALLQSIAGIGDTVALTTLAMLPELGLISNKAAAALVGVAPFVRQSGTLKAPARIHGGRAPLRNILYMAAVTASRHNRVLAPFYRKLIAAGKPPKVALVAVMRRLVVFANAVIKSGQPWKGANHA